MTPSATNKYLILSLNSTQPKSDLDSLFNWSILNSLPFNLSKFVHMSFKSKIITSYHIEDTTITRCSSHRNLGILFSDNLSWDLHYQQILAKAYKSLGLIHRTFKSHGCIHRAPGSCCTSPWSNPNFYFVHWFGNPTCSNTFKPLRDSKDEQQSTF